MQFYRSLFWNLCLGIFLLLCSAAPALADPGNDRPASFEQAIAALQQGNYAAAKAGFSEAIDLNQQVAAAYANRCLVHLHLEQYEPAIADCSHSLELQPSNREVYLNRGLAYYRLGNYPAAIADDTTFLAQSPEDGRGYFNRGLARAATGAYREAMADFNLALLQPATPADTLADFHVERGLTQLALVNLTAAIADFDAAIQLNPQHERAYYNRGCLQGRQGNYLAAIADLNQALHLNPGNPEAHLDRGVAHYNLGNTGQALKDLKQAAAVFQSQGRQVAYQHVVGLMQQIRQTQESIVT